jgi:hypothetical protein
MAPAEPQENNTSASRGVRLRQHWQHVWQEIQRQPPARRTLIYAGLTVMLVVAGLLGRNGVIAVAQLKVQTETVLIGGGSGVRIYDRPVSTIFDFGVVIGNESHDRTLTLRSISLPNGLPAHVRLLHVVYTPDRGLIMETGWPMRGEVVPLDGARVPPGISHSIALVLVADRPGAYAVGPVTVYGEVVGPLGSRLLVSQTAHQYAVICPGVTQAVCDSLPVPG